MTLDRFRQIVRLRLRSLFAGTSADRELDEELRFHVEQQIHDALSTLMQGRTTLIIAHRLSTISLADRVVVLDNGRIIADG